MSLNTKKMEYGRVYEIMRTNWFIVKHAGKLFHGDIIYTYGFNPLGKVEYVMFGKQIFDRYYDNPHEYTIKGWKIDRNIWQEGDYSKIGDPKYAEEYLNAMEDLYPISGDKLEIIQEEIEKVTRNPELYFKELMLNEEYLKCLERKEPMINETVPWDNIIRERKEIEANNPYQENNTVDGNNPVNWEEVIKANAIIGGRKHRR